MVLGAAQRRRADDDRDLQRAEGDGDDEVADDDQRAADERGEQIALGATQAVDDDAEAGLGAAERHEQPQGGHGRDDRRFRRGVTGIHLTHIGGPTVLIEAVGWRILTDPTFDPPGKTYKFGWGTKSTKLSGPALAPADLGPIDAVLLSYDHDGDNLDETGRALVATAPTVITTTVGARRLGRRVRGLDPWEVTSLAATGKSTVEVTATPCRHGPPLIRPIVGRVIGFALRWDGQRNSVVWVSGDTVLYNGVRHVADRVDVDVAIVHLGEVQFPITGPVRYSMTARDAVELCGELRPRVAVPVHYEGWSHFHEGRDAIEGEISRASRKLRGVFRLIPLGEPVDVGDES